MQLDVPPRARHSSKPRLVIPSESIQPRSPIEREVRSTQHTAELVDRPKGNAGRPPSATREEASARTCAVRLDTRSSNSAAGIESRARAKERCPCRTCASACPAKVSGEPRRHSQRMHHHHLLPMKAPPEVRDPHPRGDGRFRRRHRLDRCRRSSRHVLQKRIDEMGPVNLVIAIEEYEETEQRHTFLTHADMTTS